MIDVDAPRRPRFPWVGLALCAASVGAAVWVLMKYSFARDITPKELWLAGAPARSAWWLDGTYVRLRGKPTKILPHADGRIRVVVRDVLYPDRWTYAVLIDSAPAPKTAGAEMTFTGRVVLGLHVGSGEFWDAVDTSASRFHPASIAGLVVGAWGVFVFATAFLHWREKRRLFDSHTAEP